MKNSILGLGGRTACCLAIALLMGATLQAQQPPSQKFPPANVPPVSVRPQQDTNSPLRMSREQIEQFHRLQQQNQLIEGMPQRVHRLTDASLPNLSAVADTSVRQTSFEQEGSTEKQSATGQQTQASAAPFVPEVTKSAPPIVDSQKFSPAEQQQLPVQHLPGQQLPRVENFAAPASFRDELKSEPNSSTSENTVTVSPIRQVSNQAFPDEQQSAPRFGQPDQIIPSSDLPAIRMDGELASQEVNNGSYRGQADQLRELTAIPAIEVETTGPKSIGIGKTASYVVKATNQSQLDSNRLIVQARLPRWIEISNIITTDGHRELTQEAEGFLVTWVVPKLAAGKAQTMTVDVVPQRAEAFDLDLQWELERLASTSRVAVTEPRLEMSISGSNEVQFGDKAIYDVTVKNVGTGAAENVQVMLSEALGGARANLENIEPGANRKFQVELSARTPGELELLALAVGDANLRTSASRKIIVRRAKLEIAISAPEIKYAGTANRYQVQIRNAGDALAQNVAATMNLPTGVKYLSGLNGAEVSANSLKWNVGNLAPGENRAFEINCQMNSAGNVKVDIGARGENQLVAANAVTTRVETVADLVLSVEDPKGPLPTGETIHYTIKVKNRGSRAARQVDLTMLFSKGVEPTSAEGLEYRSGPGEVQFASIASIEPGQEISVKVVAKALEAGTHQFRAQLKCTEADSNEVAQGTTKFYGKTLQQTPPTRPASSSNQFDSSLPGGNFNAGGGQ